MTPMPYDNTPAPDTMPNETMDEGMPQEGMGQEMPMEHEETVTVPKSIGMGKDFKVGDEIVLKIVGMDDDNFTLAYAPEKPGEGGEDNYDEYIRKGMSPRNPEGQY